MFPSYFSKIVVFTVIFRGNQSKLIKMADISNFKGGQIVGARMAISSATKTAELFGEVRRIISKVMTFEKEGKTS